MHQRSFEMSVSRRTGESLQTIRQRGFSLVRMPTVNITTSNNVLSLAQPTGPRGQPGELLADSPISSGF